MAFSAFIFYLLLTVGAKAATPVLDVKDTAPVKRSSKFRIHCQTVGRKPTFAETASSASSAKKKLDEIWDTLSDDNKKYCLDGVNSYGELLACAEIRLPPEAAEAQAEAEAEFKGH